MIFGKKIAKCDFFVISRGRDANDEGGDAGTGGGRGVEEGDGGEHDDDDVHLVALVKAADSQRSKEKGQR